MPKVLLALLVCVLLLGAAPKKSTKPPAPPPKATAPEAIPHPVALFLSSMSNSGARQVTFKASAVGKRFFIEEPAGVTVYLYDGQGYRREAFMEKTTLAKAMAMSRFRVTTASR